MNIKKYSFTLALLLTFLVANAQHKPFQFGFRGGLNIGWFSTEDTPFQNDGVKIGGSYGFVADIFLMENYAFTTGFNVLYLNGNTTMTLKEGTRENQIHTRYLQLPLVFTMKTKPIREKISLYGQIGYGLAFLLQAKRTDLLKGSDGTNEEKKVNAYDELTFTRSSLILGVGVEIPVYGSTALRAGFTFDNCFITMFKGDEFRVRNSFIDLNLALLF